MKRIALFGSFHLPNTLGPHDHMDVPTREADEAVLSEFVANKQNVLRQIHTGSDVWATLIYDSLLKHLPGDVQVIRANLLALRQNETRNASYYNSLMDLCDSADASVVLLDRYNESFDLPRFVNEGDPSRTVVSMSGTWALNRALGDPTIISQLNRFAAVFEWSALLMFKLRELGLNNGHVLTNYRSWDPKATASMKPRNQLKRCVVYSGLGEPRGAQYAADAIQLLNKRRSEPIALDLYGTGNDEEMGALRRVRDADPSIRLFSHQPGDEAMLSRLAKYDCMLFPSHHWRECFSTSLLAAFASGLPIITTDWRVHAEFVRDGQNGFLVPIKDADAIANAVEYLADNPDVVRDISARNLKTYEDLYSEPRATQDFISQVKRVAQIY